MKKEDKNKISGIAGTILFHIGVLLLLIFLALRTPLPLPGEEGVMVNFGYDETGMGVDQQRNRHPAETVQQIEPATAGNRRGRIPDPGCGRGTGHREEKGRTKKKEPEKVKPKPEPEPEPVKEIVKPEPQPEPQPQVNQKPCIKVRGHFNAGGPGRKTGQPGDQGSQTGVAGVPNYTGKGGTGTQGEGTGSEGTGGDGNGPGGEGISYSLGGRGSIPFTNHPMNHENREKLW